MPLKLDLTQLNPQTLGAAPKEVAFKDKKLPADAPPEPIALKIEHAFQEGLLWCWAACIQMVRNYEQPNAPLQQCKIVRIKVGDDNHPCPADQDQRLDDCEPIDMASAWRACGIEKVVPVTGAISLKAVKEELKAHRPVEVGISWTLGGGHAVLIKGWTATEPESLIIDDPLRTNDLGLPASGLARYDDLLVALGHGSWDYTWARLEP
jgi:hypothetical protein